SRSEFLPCNNELRRSGRGSILVPTRLHLIAAEALGLAPEPRSPTARPRLRFGGSAALDSGGGFPYGPPRRSIARDRAAVDIRLCHAPACEPRTDLAGQPEPGPTGFVYRTRLGPHLAQRHALREGRVVCWCGSKSLPDHSAGAQEYGRELRARGPEGRLLP